MADGTIAISLGTVRRALVILLTTVVVIVVLLIVWQQRDRIPGLRGGVADQIDANTYQAVFLTGGQVYFGKLEPRDDVYLLRDVFYIANEQGEATGSGSTGQLIKRGKEIHAPRDPMVIPKDKVLLFENMSDDAEVLRAIRVFKSGGTPPPTPQRTTAPASSPTASPRASATR